MNDDEHSVLVTFRLVEGLPDGQYRVLPWLPVWMRLPFDPDPISLDETGHYDFGPCGPARILVPAHRIHDWRKAHRP